MRVVGVHPVEARQPVHLIELEAQLEDMPIDWPSITQSLEGRDSSYWQVPYDEHTVPGRNWHWCFFFHYLDVSRPLSSQSGDLPLPAASPAPDHLRFMRYEEP
jgi:hypothetical protein